MRRRGRSSPRRSPEDYDRVKREVPGPLRPLQDDARSTRARGGLAARHHDLAGRRHDPRHEPVRAAAPARPRGRREPGRRHRARRARVDASRGAHRGIRRLAEGHAQARPQARRRGRRADARARRPARRRRRLRRPGARHRRGAALGPRASVPMPDSAPRASGCRASTSSVPGTLEPRKGLVDVFDRARPPRASPRCRSSSSVPRAGATSTWRPSPTRAGVDAARILHLDDLDAADLAVVVGGALAFVAPSHDEGTGTALIEAFSLGTPVIHSDAAGVRRGVGRRRPHRADRQRGCRLRRPARRRDHVRGQRSRRWPSGSRSPGATAQGVQLARRRRTGLAAARRPLSLDGRGDRRADAAGGRAAGRRAAPRRARSALGRFLGREHAPAARAGGCTRSRDPRDPRRCRARAATSMIGSSFVFDARSTK